MGESNLKQWTFLLVNGVSLVAGTVGLALLLLMTLGSVYEGWSVTGFSIT